MDENKDKDEETKAAKEAIASARETSPAKPAKPAKPVETVTEPAPLLTHATRQPIDLKAQGYVKGPYIYRRNGAEMALKTVQPHEHERGHTHLLRSQELSWEGSEEDFRKEFEKK